MPRHQKSKLNSHGKYRHQAQVDAEVFGAVSEIAGAPQESSPSFRTLPDVELRMIPRLLQQASLLTANAMLMSWFDSDDYSSEDTESIYDYLAYRCINPEQLGRKVIMVLQILLNNYNMKQLTIMEDMLRVLSREEWKYLPEILRKTSEKLAAIFAVELREVESSPQTYNLISKLNLPNNGRVRPGKGLPKTGFLMGILALIFMNGNSIGEEYIWEILKEMEVYPGKKHVIYGEPRKLINHYLVNLKYLEYRQVAKSEPPRYEFLWGPQAQAETSKMQVLKFLAKANNITPCSFANLYKEALKDEQERSHTKDAPTPDPAANAKVVPVAICKQFVSPVLKIEIPLLHANKKLQWYKGIFWKTKET